MDDLDRIEKVLKKKMTNLEKRFAWMQKDMWVLKQMHELTAKQRMLENKPRATQLEMFSS